MHYITFFLMYLTSHILLVIQETVACVCVSLDLTHWLSSFQKFKSMLLSCNVLQRNSKMFCLMIYSKNNVIDSQGDWFHLLKNCRCTYILIHVYIVSSCWYVQKCKSLHADMFKNVSLYKLCKIIKTR